MPIIEAVLLRKINMGDIKKIVLQINVGKNTLNYYSVWSTCIDIFYQYIYCITLKIILSFFVLKNHFQYVDI